MSIDFEGPATRLQGRLPIRAPKQLDTVTVNAFDLAMVLMERQTLLTANGLQADKIEGMEADLFQAVATAYRRGAKVWTRMNYREYYERLLEEDASNGR